LEALRALSLSGGVNVDSDDLLSSMRTSMVCSIGFSVLLSDLSVSAFVREFSNFAESDIDPPSE
jgi:hypothetical protein